MENNKIGKSENDTALPAQDGSSALITLSEDFYFSNEAFRLAYVSDKKFNKHC